MSEPVLTGKVKWAMKRERRWFRFNTKAVLAVEEKWTTTHICYQSFDEHTTTNSRWRRATHADALNLERMGVLKFNGVLANGDIDVTLLD